MNRFYILLLSLFTMVGIAQAPANYYNSATGTGYTLKTQLYNIIKGHNDRGYPGLYTTYRTSDIDIFYENNRTMLDMYSEIPTGPDAYEYTYGQLQDDGTLGNNEGERYNREHLIPQSVFSSATPMYSDAHFVVPSDKKVNGVRNNFPFGKVQNASFTSTNGSKLGNNTNSGYSAGYSQTVFEPIDEFKGDIARMLLYFATRYENVVAGYSYVMFNNTSNQVFTNTFKNILLEWHRMDPVSDREILRNNAVYARQNNRNPYIDRPEFVNRIWGPALAIETFENLANVSVYPNPANDQKINIYSETDLDAIQLININGQTIIEVQKPVSTNHNYTLENLPQGFYFLKMVSGNQNTTKKVMVN